MKAVTIRHSGAIQIEDLQKPIHRSAGQIVGGLIEMVYPARLNRPYCMICNEEYLLQGLPINLVGSYLYRTDVHGHPICGNVIISKVEGDDLVGLTDEEAKDIVRAMQRVKQVTRLVLKEVIENGNQEQYPLYAVL